MIWSEDFYDDIKNDVEEWIDSSNYPKNHPSVERVGFPVGKNKKIPGKMKDECGGKMITEFVGVSSKCYSYLTDDGKDHKKAKGIVKAIAEKELRQHYKDCVLKKEEKKVSQNVIRGHQLVNYTENVSKVALNPKDTKRYILEDGISTLPFGHWRLVMRDGKVIHYIDKNEMPEWNRRKYNSIVKKLMN